MQIHVLKKSSPTDMTRKYEKLCGVAFIRKFDSDAVIKIKNKCHILVENCLSYNILKSRRKPITDKRDNLN